MIIMFSFHEEVQWIVEATAMFCQRHQLSHTLSPEQALELIRCMMDDSVSERLHWASVGQSYNQTAERMLPWYTPAAMDTLADSFWSLVMDKAFGQVRLAVQSAFPSKVWDVVAVSALKDDTIVIDKINDWRILQYEQLVEEHRVLPEGWECRFVHGHPIVIQSVCDPKAIGSLSDRDCELKPVTDGYGH
jgi:hypothetical protein